VDKFLAALHAFARILTSVPVLTLVMLLLFELWLRQGNPMDAIGVRNVDSWDLFSHPDCRAN